MTREADLEQAVRLVLSLHDHPESNVPGYRVKLDPKTVKQLQKALEKKNHLVQVVGNTLHDKIAAIRELRTLTGLGLPEARAAVEGVMEGVPWLVPELHPVGPGSHPHLRFEVR
ncbi:MAG: ribosomal protein L7/L12 [Parcubacteria group bacterium]|jgi:hypothetical protein